MDIELQQLQNLLDNTLKNIKNDLADVGDIKKQERELIIKEILQNINEVERDLDDRMENTLFSKSYINGYSDAITLMKSYLNSIEI